MTTVSAAPSALRLIASDIKLGHSVFALPFALLAAFMAGPRAGDGAAAWARFGGQAALIVVCMVLARTWAMLVNRLADRRFDAANERTSKRVFAAGRVSPALGWTIAITCAMLFVGVCGMFRVLYQNSWPLWLSVPTLGLLAFYSFTKRFTALCHFVVGLALAVSPLAAAIAIDPAALRTQPALWWIAGFVAFWVGGFDVIYALQDEAFDRTSGLSSIPAAIGTSGAAWVARGSHALSLLCLLAAWTSRDARFSWLFGAGIVLVAALLAVEHALLTRSLSPRTPSPPPENGAAAKPGLHVFFFSLNGVVACLLGAAGIVDVLW